MNNQLRFKDKTVLVTGGAAGIGRSVCEAFAARGAIVYAADINETGLADLAAKASAAESITAVRLDVSRPEDFEEAIAQILADHGRLDIIVNNAGYTWDNVIQKMDD